MTEPESTETEGVQDNSNKKYLVRGPWHCDLLHSPNGDFPDIVAGEAVEMSGDEVEAAKAAAKTAGFLLRTKEA